MQEKAVSMSEVRETINHLVQGVDPYTGEVLEEITFLQNPRMIRCFAVMSELSTRVIEKQERLNDRNRESFSITKEGIAKIVLPKGDCGAKKMTEAINKVIDERKMKSLSAYNINRQLIESGILSSKEVDGRKTTVTNERSEKYGFISVHVDLGDRSYDKIVYKAEAKRYIIEHLLEWFA